ncbi:MAG: hypothetical protein M1836_002277 [Candelina mexicana]|nr:MAG: hypothetical protein M1836_002277 [Candelina mexicana]
MVFILNINVLTCSAIPRKAQLLQANRFNVLPTRRCTYHPPTSTLLFSTASSNFSKTLTDIKRSSLSIPNRLRSLQQDSRFVLSVADTFNLPLIANERCGGWYIPPERKASSAYFKSTDGHTGQWKFSLRRLNLHVLDVVAEHGG